MSLVKYRVCEPPDSLSPERLADLLASEEPTRYDDLLQFWIAWFHNDIPGQKITVIAEAEDERTVGVVRFWRSPFCEQKWLVEGLEVHPDWRRRGIGEQLLLTGISHLARQSASAVWSHIRHDNAPSIRLHQRVGFRLVSHGYVNSWGDYRANGGEYVLNLRSWNQAAREGLSTEQEV